MKERGDVRKKLQVKSNSFELLRFFRFSAKQSPVTLVSWQYEYLRVNLSKDETKTSERCQVTDLRPTHYVLDEKIERESHYTSRNYKIQVICISNLIASEKRQSAKTVETRTQEWYLQLPTESQKFTRHFAPRKSIREGRTPVGTKYTSVRKRKKKKGRGATLSSSFVSSHVIDSSSKKFPHIFQSEIVSFHEEIHVPVSIKL